MLLPALIVCLTTAMVSTHGETTPVADPPLTFERTIIDLGPVSDDQPIRQPFKFVYTGARMSALHFNHCHFCPEPESDRPRYEPGQSGLVILQLDTQGKYGEIQTTADVSIPGEADSNVTLQLKATVHPRLMIRPPFLTLRGVRRSEGTETNLVFIGRRPDFEVLSVRSESPWVEVSLGAVRELEDLGDKCRAYDVAVRFKPGLPLGDFQAVIRSKTNDPIQPDMGTTIDAEVVGELIPDQDHVTVGSLKPNQPFAAEFTLTARGGKPLFYGSVKLASAKIRGVPPMAFDVEPGTELGTLKVKVYGAAPSFRAG
jgi:hypothetical protein